MKSILYVGATLMIGASIYGFVDYKKNQNKAEFKNLYTEVKKTVEEPVPVEPVIKPTEKNDKVAITSTTTPADAVKKSTLKNKKATKKIKKKRKVSVRLFSRGGLDDEYIEPVKPVAGSGVKN